MFDSSLWNILVAGLAGAAIGVERQRTGHASGAHAHLGGVRTLTLLGGVAGVAGWLALQGFAAFGVVIATGAAALVVAGYVAAGRRDVDATTEAAALVVVAAGLLAGLGRLALASGVAAITVLLLVEKSRLHAAVGRIDDEELRAGARFGVMAVVVLPLLPPGPYGPLGGVRPQQLWLLVLFFTGMSFAGFIARRAVGARRGYPLAGLLGGLVSSTNVTLAFARLSRTEAALGATLGVAAVGACTMLVPRVLLATLVLEPRVAAALWPYLAAPFTIGAGAVLAGLRGGPPSQGPPRRLSNPLQLWPALQMALLFQVVLFAVFLARGFFGDAGMIASGAVLGLTDADALTVSMAHAASQGLAPRIAARAIATGILSNSAVKAGIALAFGGPAFRRVAGSVLGATIVALGASLLLLR